MRLVGARPCRAGIRSASNSGRPAAPCSGTPTATTPWAVADKFDCERAFWSMRLSDPYMVPIQISSNSHVTSASVWIGDQRLETCVVSWQVHDQATDSLVERTGRAYTQGITFVFDELIWVEEPHFGRG